MKKIFIMVVLTIFAALPAMAVTIKGSKHDMIASGYAIGTDNSEICIFCHTPHGAQALTQAPLWNNTPEDVTAIYRQTSGGAGDTPGSKINFITDINNINATDARLCLACHDGTVSLPVNMPNGGADITVPGATALTASANLGTDLSNDHPIGMDLGATPETNPVVGGASGIRALVDIAGGAVGFGFNPFFRAPGDLASVNIMWCSSCHDVHDNVNDPFLRKDNAGSNLCKACHKK